MWIAQNIEIVKIVQFQSHKEGNAGFVVILNEIRIEIIIRIFHEKSRELYSIYNMEKEKELFHCNVAWRNSEHIVQFVESDMTKVIQFTNFYAKYVFSVEIHMNTLNDKKI